MNGGGCSIVGKKALEKSEKICYNGDGCKVAFKGIEWSKVCTLGQCRYWISHFLC